MGQIYLLTFPNGKGYVGQTRQTTGKRLAQHRRDLKKRISALYNAWRHYGEPHCLVLGEIPDAQLDTQEIAAIALLGTQRPNGYNIAAGGSSAEMADETRRKIGDANRGRREKPEVTARRAALLRGRKHTPETIAKRAAAGTGKKRSPESCARLSAARKRWWDARKAKP